MSLLENVRIGVNRCTFGKFFWNAARASSPRGARVLLGVSAAQRDPGEPLRGRFPLRRAGLALAPPSLSGPSLPTA